MRTIIELTDEQVERLRELCQRENISRAEAIRRGVDLLLESDQQDEDEFEKALQAAFGSWKDCGVDAVEYQQALRAEWNRASA